jgi:hypothetical protein
MVPILVSLHHILHGECAVEFLNLSGRTWEQDYLTENEGSDVFVSTLRIVLLPMIKRLCLNNFKNFKSMFL